MDKPSRWENSNVARGADYDARWRELAATGVQIHGEADLVENLVAEFKVPKTVLDAGCGTGRVAIELARRGFDLVGIDRDAPMLDAARTKARELEWIQADLSTFTSDKKFGAAVLAGNVMIFLAAGTEATAVENIVGLLHVGGLFIAGFQLSVDRLPLDRYDELCADAGLVLEARFATWDREAFSDGDYAVSVHRRA